MKKKITVYSCLALLLVSILIIIITKPWKQSAYTDAFSDGIEWVDPNTIHLEDSKVYVNFSDVILSKQNETRKLIVAEQNAKVSVDLKDKMFEHIDIAFLDKTQTIKYNAIGYFVVDLDHLTNKSIDDDQDKKMLTIKIEHAHLEAVDIDPNKVIINNVEGGLFSSSDIKITVRDYNKVEKELKKRITEQLDTADNGQKADEIALKKVKEIYEPIVKEIDPSYNVSVVFETE